MKNKYHTTFVYLITAFCFVQGIIFYNGVHNNKKAILSVDNTSIDFGEISYGEKLTRKFSITNLGNADLKINKIKTGCGCLAVQLSRDVIRPNSTEYLYVTNEGKNHLSKVNIYVFSNDDNSAVKVLQVKSAPLKYLYAHNKSIDMGRIENHLLPVTKEVKYPFISNSLTCKITPGVSFLNTMVDVSDDTTTSIKITVLPNAPAGDIFNNLVLDSGNEQESIRIIGTIVGECYALPQSLLFGPIFQNDQPIQRSIVINQRNNNSSSFQIKSCSVSNTLNECVYIKDIQDKKFSVVFDPNLHKGVWTSCSITGHIEISVLIANSLKPQYVIVPVIVTMKQTKIRD